MTPIVRKAFSLAALGACFVATVASEGPVWMVSAEKTPDPVSLTREAPAARRVVTMRVTPGDRDAGERSFSSLELQFTPTFTPDEAFPGERPWLEARLAEIDVAEERFDEHVARGDSAGALGDFSLYHSDMEPNVCPIRSGCTRRFQLDVERDPYTHGTLDLGWKLAASIEAVGRPDAPAGMTIELTVE